MSKEKKIEKVRKLKDVVYPIFQDCSKLMKDDFWIKLFDDLSRSKCPKGIMIYNGVISSSYKRNGFSYSFIDSKDPVKLSNDIQEQLKKYACIYSNKDIVNKESDLSNANNEYVNAKHADNWKKIKSKKMKENLITNYCLEMKKKYKLSYSKIRILYTLIKDSLYLYKTHKSDDIVMKNGKIDFIKDIEFETSIECFINTRDIQDDIIQKNKKIKDNILDLKWKNYLSIIIKEIVKNYTETN